MGASKYRAIMKSSMQISIAYRTAYFSNLFFSFIKTACQFFIWSAIYSNHTSLSGYTWESMKLYLFITFICNNLMSLRTDYEVSKKIMYGSVVMDLLRPISFQKANFAEIVGASIFEGAISTFIIGFVMIIMFGIHVPADPVVLILFLVSVIISLFVRYGIIFSFSMFCFWTTSINGIVALRTAITSLFSGTLIPFTFFPDWFEHLALFLPFQALIYTPASILLQNQDVLGSLSLIIQQIFWVVVMWACGALLWRIAVKKLTVYGG